MLFVVSTRSHVLRCWLPSWDTISICSASDIQCLSSFLSLRLAQRTAIDEDNVDFPLVSSSDTLTLSYTVNGTKSGRLMLSVSSSKWSKQLVLGILLYIQQPSSYYCWKLCVHGNFFCEHVQLLFCVQTLLALVLVVELSAKATQFENTALQ